jgi:hypothetical protein
MTERIYRSITEPLRGPLTYNERWKGSDKGSIISWEIGRKLAKEKPELAERAKNDELPLSGWKGGTDNQLKVPKKFGAMFYLAEWQGLRGEDLDIDITQEPTLTCSKTGLQVTYTFDIDKYGKA